MADRPFRWRVALTSSLLLAGAGVWFLNPLLVIAGIAPLGFVAYNALSTAPPSGSAVILERTISPLRTYPGGAVDVELTVTNRYDGQLIDLRIVDGVPDDLAVIDGSPRAAVTLEEGQTAAIEYSLRARYGEFEFGPTRVRTASLSAASVNDVEENARGDGRVAATLNPDAYPLGSFSVGTAGELTIDRGGEGLEFYGIRAYQPEDPLSRINWRQYAKERRLSTVDYRQQEALDVMVIVDARRPTRVASGETAPTGTELAVYVANEVVAALFANRNRVGIAGLGVDSSSLTAATMIDHDFGWVSPGSGRAVRARIRSVLDAAAATASPEWDETEQERGMVDPLTIIRQLSRQTQVILVSPLCDDEPIGLVRQLRQTGHAVSVYSPAVTNRSTVGGRIESAPRSVRIAEIRRLGMTVVDWDPDHPLAVAFDRPNGHATTSLSQP